jgi:hypothetical protein
MNEEDVEPMSEAGRVLLRDWIYEHNLRPFLEALSWLEGCAFDQLDWDAVTFGLAQAFEKDESFEYTLGSITLGLRGPFLVFFDIEVDAALERGVEVVVKLMQGYEWSRDMG